MVFDEIIGLLIGPSLESGRDASRPYDSLINVSTTISRLIRAIALRP